MDLLSTAKELEKSAILFYEDLVTSNETKEYKSIFKDLAREERRHYEIFDTWQKNEHLPDIEHSVPELTNTDEIFKHLSSQFKISPGEFFSRSQIFGMAIELERKSINHYELIANSPDIELSAHRAVVRQIIAQEENHIRFISALTEFLRHPGEWLENAEFYHLDEY